MRTRRGGDDGYILVAVLAVAVVLTGLVAAGSVVVRSALGTAAVADAAVADAGLATSGLEIAAYQLAVLKIAPDAVDGRRIRLTGGTVTPHVTDEAGKVDLNAATPAVLEAVFVGVGMDEATARDVVARVVELRGPTNGVMPDAAAPTAATPASLAPGGGQAGGGQAGGGQAGGGQAGGPQASGGQVENAPIAQGPGAGGSTPPKRRGLQTVEDLRDIDGVRRADMRLLRQRFTVYNPDGRLDVMTADPDLLRSLPGMTKLKLTQLLAARESGSENAARDAQAALGGDVASYTKVLAGPAFTVQIDAVGTNGRRTSAEAVIAASKSPNQPYYILDWRG